LIVVEEAVMIEAVVLLPILRAILGEIEAIKSEMVTKKDVAALSDELGKEIGCLFSEVQSLRTDIASGLIMLESRLGGGISNLSQTISEHHSTTVGNRRRISKFQKRLVRVEQHLQPPPDKEN
jgi:hypothetical protein